VAVDGKSVSELMGPQSGVAAFGLGCREAGSAYRIGGGWDEFAGGDGGYIIQRAILSQWFLFLVPDLKILRLHIVSLLCVSGALVDLEFFVSFSRPISHFLSFVSL
jgi:hypothetical protein